MLIKGISYASPGMSKVCHGWEHNDAVWESVPMNYSSGGQAVLIVVSRSRHLSACKRVDEF